jgi:hypothetical protein
MSDDVKEKPGSDGVRESLQGYADVLASVILASRMVHGVTVAISVRDPGVPVGEPETAIMASNTSIQGLTKNAQMSYSLVHLETLQANAREAHRDIAAAIGQLEAKKKKGGLN